MSFGWPNLLAWWVQIALLVAAGAAVPSLFRLRSAKARLLLWHALLALCAVLPVIEPWQQSPIEDGIQIITSVTVPLSAGQTSGGIRLDWSEIAFGILLAGGLWRLAWLGLGLWRLRR